MPQKKRKIFLPLSLASLSLFFILLPTIVSTELGKTTSLTLINHFSSEKVAIKNLSLSWLGAQKIEELQYDATTKGFNLTCQKISIDSGLLKMFFFKKDLSTIEVIQPSLVITSDFISQPSIAKTPLEASFLPKLGSIESFQKDLTKFKGHIILKEGSLEVKIPGTQNLVFSPIEMNMTLQEKDHPSTLALQIDSLQGDVRGHLQIKGSLDQESSLNASCSHFPLKGADQIIGLLKPRYKDVLVDTIGPSLDMDCSITGKENLFETKIALQAQNLEINLQILLKEDITDLLAPAFLQVTLTPEGNKKASFLFPDIPLIATASPITLRFNIDALHMPLKENGIDIEKTSFTSSFTSDTYPVTPIMQAKIKGTLSSLQLQDNVTADVAIEIQAQKNLSQIALTGILTSPLTDHSSIKASLTTQKIPTSLLDTLFPFSSSLILGSWIEGKCQLEGDFQESNISLQIDTPLFSLVNTKLEWDDKKLTLLNPVTFTYQVTPSLLESFIGKDSILLKEPILATVEISEASLSKDISLETKISIPTLSFDRFFSLENYSFPALEISTKIDTLANIHLEAKNSLLHLNSHLKLTEQKLTLLEPLEVSYTLVKQDFSLNQIPFSLLEEAKVKLVCAPTSVYLKDLKKTKLQAHLDVSTLHLENKQRKKELLLENLYSDVSFLGAKELLDFSFQFNLNSHSPLQNTLKGSLSLQKVLTDKDFSSLSLNLNIDHLSLNLLEDFYTLPLELSSLIGDTLSSSLHLEKTTSLQSLSIEVSTPVLKAKGTLAIEDDKLFFPKNSGPFTIEYTLTPKSYKTLTKKSPFALSENAIFTSSITELNVPYLKNTLLPDLSKTKIKAIALNEKAVFQKDGSQESIVLSATKISLQKEASQKDLTLGVDSKAIAPSLPEGALHLNLVLSKFLNEEGIFNLKDLQVSAQASATRFPSTALDIACSLKKEPFAVFLGPSFDATLDFSLQNATGPIAFNLCSSKAHMDFIGKMESGSLKLVKDLKADILLTITLGKFLLDQINVPSIQSLFAPTPLTINISSQGFSFPIHSMNFSEIQIPFMKVDFGKVYCKNKGAILSLLRQLKSKEPEGKELQTWFAPMDIHVKDGVVDIERTEILIDKTYDVALWGEVNLPYNFVNMTFGLTAEALKIAFGIQDLPKNYVLKIPIKGTLQDVKVKSGTATSKITALLLWQSKALSDAIGPFGGLLKKVIPPPSGDGKAPDPKTPYPWQIGYKP